MRIRKFAIFTLSCLLSAILTQASADAGWIKDRLREAKRIVKDVPDVLIPYKPQIDIITGKKDPVQAFAAPIQAQGRILVNTVDLARNIDGTINNAIVDTAAKLGGDGARIYVEVVNAPDRYVKEFSFTAASQAGAIMQGQDPLVAVALPLAAAIRDAENKYSGSAKPVPPEIAELLRPVIPVEVLSRARYSVDNLKISLPSIINSGQQLFGNEYAVTVNSVIVFEREPDPDDINDLEWWAHELHHVYQYQVWGVDQFAFNYLKDSGRVEAEARNSAAYVRRYLEQLQGGMTAIAPSRMIDTFSITEPVSIQTPLGSTVVYREKQVVSQPSFSYTDRCNIMGEDILITSSHQVISFSRGGQIVAQRQAPLNMNCVFDLISINARFCVSRMDGTVWAGGPTPLGQCRPCNAPGVCGF